MNLFNITTPHDKRTAKFITSLSYKCFTPLIGDSYTPLILLSWKEVAIWYWVEGSIHEIYRKVWRARSLRGSAIYWNKKVGQLNLLSVAPWHHKKIEYNFKIICLKLSWGFESTNSFFFSWHRKNVTLN